MVRSMPTPSSKRLVTEQLAISCTTIFEARNTLTLGDTVLINLILQFHAHLSYLMAIPRRKVRSRTAEKR